MSDFINSLMDSSNEGVAAIRRSTIHYTRLNMHSALGSLDAGDAGMAEEYLREAVKHLQFFNMTDEQILASQVEPKGGWPDE